MVYCPPEVYDDPELQAAIAHEQAMLDAIYISQYFDRDANTLSPVERECLLSIADAWIGPLPSTAIF
jgi:hypothetical protein